MDDFIQELCGDTGEDYDEPGGTGDVRRSSADDRTDSRGCRKPLPVSDGTISCGQYWTEEKDVNLAAYQMGAEVLDPPEYPMRERSLITTRNRRKTRNYQVDLKAMQYDLFYMVTVCLSGAQDSFIRTES